MRKTKLKQQLSQKFNNCSTATIYAEPHDLLYGIGIFYKLNIKKIYVKCDDTGKVISKKYWDETTKNIGNELRKKLRITKGGWYLIGAMILFVVFAIPYAMYQGNAAKDTYLGKTREEKQAIRATLNKGDLLRTTNAIFRIENVNDKTLKITKSTVVPTNHMNEDIESSKYGNETFKNEMIINKQSFIKNGMINKNLKDEYGGEYAVFQILDKE